MTNTVNNTNTTFDINAALEAAKSVQKRCSSSKFDVEAVLSIIRALGGATPAQVCAAYNAGYNTELKTKVFSDWLWGQEKKGRLSKVDHVYSVVEETVLA